MQFEVEKPSDCGQATCCASHLFLISALEKKLERAAVVNWDSHGETGMEE